MHCDILPSPTHVQVSLAFLRFALNHFSFYERPTLAPGFCCPKEIQTGFSLLQKKKEAK